MKYVALLRAVNVGGRIVKMEKLRGIFTDAGFDNVSTYIQSGNVLFDSDENEQTLIPQIEEILGKALGYKVPVILRKQDDLTKTFEQNPFFEYVGLPEYQIYVGFMVEPPPEDIKNANTFGNINIVGREIYILINKSAGQSIADKLPISKPLEKLMTGRNWNTVNKLYKLLEN